MPDPKPVEMVSVPKALLADVLDNAESDSYSTESEFACADEHYEAYANERRLINELRAIAGIAEGENGVVVGQGFFGMAAALADKSRAA